MTTAGRHHRVCVATSRRSHPHILESGLARSPPLPIILCVYTSAHHFRWIRDNAAVMYVSNVYNIKTETDPYIAVSDALARIEECS